MPQDTAEEKSQRKEKREDMAGKVLKEKGSEMNRTDKAFIETFAKKEDCGSGKNEKK